MKKEKKYISVSKEIIWHLTCGECHFYWTIPTMSPKENITRRKWNCPLCGKKNEAKLIEKI